MSAHSAMATYTPKFSAPAHRAAADRWGQPDVDPDHVRMIRAIRRLPGQDQTLVEARDVSDQLLIEAAKRDWLTWRRRAWVNGVEVRYA